MRGEPGKGGEVLEGVYGSTVTECLPEQPEEGKACLVSQLQRCQSVVVCCTYLGKKIMLAGACSRQEKRRNYGEGSGQDTGS